MSQTLSPESQSNSAIRVVALISAAHFFSHFYMLVMPALLPVMTGIFDVGYTELGIAIAAYSVGTALLQAPMGFAVDRYGPIPFLVAGLTLTSLAFAAVGLTTSYVVLVGLMLLAGCANSVFHPTNYAILSANVPEHMMGRAFSVHSFAAQIGNAAGPLTVLGLLTLTDFASAMLIAGMAGALLALVIFANIGCLRQQPTMSTAGREATSKGGLRLLFSAPILLGFTFFALSAVNHRGVTGFGAATLNEVHGLDLTSAGIALGAYLAGTPFGVLTGGWLADRTSRHGAIAMAMFAAIAVCLGVLAWITPPLWVAATLFFLVGYLQGVATPSRDLLVRAATPPGQIGKVFGFVSTGLNVSGVVVPPALGYLLDHGHGGLVFWILGSVALMTVVVAGITGSGGVEADAKER